MNKSTNQISVKVNYKEIIWRRSINDLSVNIKLGNILKEIVNTSGRMYTKPLIARVILEIIQKRLIVRAYACTRAMLLYFVGRARCQGGSALATGYFWFHIPARCIFGARRARCCISFSREEKEGLRKGREFVTEREHAKKAACHGYAKSLESAFYRVYYNGEREPLSLACHDNVSDFVMSKTESRISLFYIQ